MLPLVRKTLRSGGGMAAASYGAAFELKPDLDHVPALADEREAHVAAGQRRRIPERGREAGSSWGCRSCRRSSGWGTGVVRGGGSRFLYEPFDAASARIEVNERIQEERWQHLDGG